jgi:hypothetical protein
VRFKGKFIEWTHDDIVVCTFIKLYSALNLHCIVDVIVTRDTTAWPQDVPGIGIVGLGRCCQFVVADDSFGLRLWGVSHCLDGWGVG